MVFFAPETMKFGDFDLIEHDGKLFCIFIQRSKTKITPPDEKGNTYGLAVSEDGLSWNDMGPVKKPGNPGAWNSGSLWAMSLLKHKGRFAMVYSAVPIVNGDAHSNQQMGLAFSDDLEHWEDHENNPVITNDDTGEYYYSKYIHKFCWRDPNIYEADGKFYCIFAAKDRKRPYEQSGCIALFESEDLIKWTAKPPLFSLGNHWEIETPHIYRIGDLWYLIFGNYHHGMSMSFAVSREFLGPYHEPHLNTFAPAMCYAARLIHFKGQYLFYHWIRDKIRGKKQTYLAPPKIVEADSGHIWLRKHPMMDDLFPKMTGNNILAGVSRMTKRRCRLNKIMSNIGFHITIKGRNEDYRKNIFFNTAAGGLSVRDFTFDSMVNDLRTLDIPLSDNNAIDIFVEDRFMEVYVNDYFVYATIMEADFRDIEKIELW